MTTKLFKTPVIEKQVHYGREVWANVEMDKLRKTECLCFNCANLPCKNSDLIYNICKTKDMAMMITS